MFFAPTSQETVEDRKRYLEGHLVQVSCLDCLAQVLVRKQSDVHTSIQWTDEAVAACAELSRARREDDYRAVRGCSRLQDSIRSAVRAGTVETGGSVD